MDLNEAKRTKIGCTIRPFDCANYKHKHLCNLYETDCDYAKKVNYPPTPEAMGFLAITC